MNNNQFNLDNLIKLLETTQTELQNKAARSVDIALVVRNWLFGGYIVQYQQNGSDRAEYGSGLLKELSKVLSKKLGRGFSVDNLELMRKFYIAYQGVVSDHKKSETLSRIFESISETLPRKSLITQVSPLNLEEICHALSEKFRLGWSHYVTLQTIQSDAERKFYEIEAVENSWSVRELKRQIGSSLYERLALSRDKEKIKELSEKGQLIGKADDILKNPYVLEFLNLPEYPHYSEHDLETAIIDRLEHFLLELGKGFLFEARQKRFTFDDDHFYVDLVFYNRMLRCYVLIDLKRDKLTHQDLGQMQMYTNYFDRFVKTEDEAPTIGIILCHRKNDALVELTLPKEANIYASKYQLYLPSKEELIKQVEKSLKKSDFSDKKQ